MDDADSFVKETVRKDRLDAVRDDARKVLREARIGYTGLNVRNDAVEVRISKDTDVPAALTKLRDMYQLFPVSLQIYNSDEVYTAVF